MSNSEHKDYLLFIAQDTLQEIRESKKDQRSIAYNFVIVAGVLFGLFETLKSKFNVQIPSEILKFFIAVFALVTVYFIIRFQISLANFRKRITKIWSDEGFEFAFKGEILKYENDCKEQYYSFWNNFFGFTFVYILLVFLVAGIVFVLL
jgi:hypothetical protein